MSSADEDPPPDSARRKFDEVASLFGPIVPPAGSPVRPRVPSHASSLPQAPESKLNTEDGPRLAPPPKLRAPPAEKLPSRPAADPVRPESPLSVTAPIVIPPPPQARSAADPAADAAPAPAEKQSGARADKGARLERKAAGDVPWPDAFAPRPNYKPTQKSRLLYWLFLIPFAAVVAVAVTLIDPKSIRSFIDQTLPQYLPAAVTQWFARPASTPVKPEPSPPTSPAASAPDSPTPAETTQPAVAPAPPSPPPSAAVETVPAAPPSPPEPPAPAPSAAPAAPTATTEPAPVATPPAAPTAPIAAPAPPPVVTPPEAPPPAPAAPTAPPPPTQGAGPDVSTPAPVPSAADQPSSPSPANDGSEPIPLPPPPPPPPAGQPGAAVAGSARVTIYYRRNRAGAEGEARRVAAKIGNADIRPSTNTARSPMIYYFHPSDREAATALARSLAGEGGAGWIVRAGPTRSTAGTIDVLLP